MILNEAGKVAEKCWLAISEHFPQVKLEEFIIMPNHVHGIIQINVGANHIRPQCTNVSDMKDISNINVARMQSEYDSPVQKNSRPSGTSNTIGSMVRGFKTGVTQWFRANTNTHNVWHRNYHEHIIRNENAYWQISNYVQTNPQKWQEDCFLNPPFKNEKHKKFFSKNTRLLCLYLLLFPFIMKPKISSYF